MLMKPFVMTGKCTGYKSIGMDTRIIVDEAGGHEIRIIDGVQMEVIERFVPETEFKKESS